MVFCFIFLTVIAIVVGKLSRDLNHMDQKDDSWDPIEMYREDIDLSKGTIHQEIQPIAAMRVAQPKQR